MGLFGGGNSRSSTKYETNNYDQSTAIGSGANVQERGAINLGLGSSFASVDAGGILADELNQQIDNADRSVHSSSSNLSTTTKAASDNISLSGDNITFQGFSDKAAEVVNNAVSALGLSMQTSTGQKIVGDETKSMKAKQHTSGGIKTTTLVYIALGIGAFIYFKKKGKI